MEHGHTDTIFSVVALSVLVLVSAGYYLSVLRLYRQGHRWSRWRCYAFGLGMLLLMGSLAPPMMAYAHGDFRGHMLQHLLMGMLAPLGLVLAAPLTLLLRTLPVAGARWLTQLLRSGPSRVLTHPVTALLLNIGGMYLLYLTSLYSLSLNNAGLHYLIHIHFLLAGYLFIWAILAGPDASPHSPSFRTRFVVLFISMAAHANLGKVMYGYLWPRNTPHSPEQIQSAAQLMYYGGDLAEMLLLVTLLSFWYRDRRRQASSGTPRPALGAINRASLGLEGRHSG